MDRKLTVLEHGWPREDFEQRIRPVIDQMMLDRAWIMNSYAQLEFLLADVIVKCRKFKEYAELNSKPLPFGIDGRIERMCLLIEQKPLSAYANDIAPILDRILVLEDTRHFFSHGFVSFHITRDGQNMAMHFRRYKPPKKGEAETRVELLVLPNEMAEAKTRWSVFAQTAVETFRRVYDELGLEAHDVTDGNPLKSAS